MLSPASSSVTGTVAILHATGYVVAAVTEGPSGVVITACVVRLAGGVPFPAAGSLLTDDWWLGEGRVSGVSPIWMDDEGEKERIGRRQEYS